jgi:ArsR family transcriptional regulator
MKLPDAAHCLESLGNDTRLTVYRALVRAGPGGLAVGQLQNRLEIPGSTLSHHIAHLVKNDLVAQNREGRVLRCTANYSKMNALLAFLSEECCEDSGGCD